MNGSFPEIKIKRTFEQAFNANISKTAFVKKMLKSNCKSKRIYNDYLFKKEYYERNRSI